MPLINGLMGWPSLCNFNTGLNSGAFAPDVVNLYCNIPVDKAITVLKTQLERSKKLSKGKIKEVVNMVNMILRQNYFTYNGEIYHCRNGVAMGGPLSSTIATLYLNFFEEKFIMNDVNPYYRHLHFYGRFVDDTISVTDLDDNQIDELLCYLNQCVPGLVFTCEIGGKMLNFLDVTIKIVNNRFEFSIFRKPMTTDIVIPNDSNHPRKHKHAAFHALVHRALNIPMSKNNLDKELDIIRQIGNNNGYPLHEINSIIKKHTSQQNNIKLNKKDRKFVSLSYFNEFSNKIGNVFRKFGLEPGFGTKHSIGANLNKRKKELVEDKYNISGIYSIECSDCDVIYIGKSARNFKTRFNEHLRDPKSHIFQHLKSMKHRINSIEENMKIKHVCRDDKKLNILEKVEIRRAVLNGAPLLNAQIEVSSAASDLIDLCCKLSDG